MRVNFKFISDVFSYWSAISYVRLESIEFLIEEPTTDKEIESLLTNGFPPLEYEPVARVSDVNELGRTIIIDGAGFRVDFLEPSQSEKIINCLSSSKELSITDALTGEEEPNILVFKKYLDILSMTLSLLEEKYLNELTEILTADWNRGMRCTNDLLRSPGLISEAECERLHAILMKDINDLENILDIIELEYPREESDVISLCPNYSPSFDANRLGINLFKAATIACIRELNQYAEQLTPTYYKNAIQEYKATFIGLFSQLPGYEEEKRALILNIYNTYIPEHYESIGVIPLSAIYANFNRLIKIVTIMSEHHVLNYDTFHTLEMIFQLPEDEPNKKIIQIDGQITSLSQLQLLMPETLVPLFITDASFPDKSCPARTTVTNYAFFGSASRDEGSYKHMWSIYCIGVEHQLVKLMEERKSLSEQLKFAAEKRQGIAMYRKETSNYQNFGSNRTGKSLHDTYSNDNRSIINTSLFPIVSRIIRQHYDLEALLEASPPRGHPSDNKYEIINVYKLLMQLDHEEIELPEQEMQIIVKRTKKSGLKPIKVIVQFSELNREHYEKMLSHFDEHFLEKCRNKEFNNEEFVTKLGRLIYYLVRSYPFNRGTGAILQWEARSLVSYYTDGQVNLGDIRLGGNEDYEQGIPYDVYAHLVQSPESYAVAFKKAILPLLIANEELNQSYEMKG